MAWHDSLLFPVAPLPLTLPEIPAPKRNSFSRLWPAQMSSHSRFTFRQTPQQELPEAPALLDLAEHRFNASPSESGIALTSSFRPQLGACHEDP